MSGAWVEPVEGSDAVEAIGYAPASGQLLVRFTSGEVYVYADVPAPLMEAFRAAPSKGRFFQNEVRNRFAFTRVDLDDG